MSDGVDVLQSLHDVRVLVAPLTRRRDVILVFNGCDALPHATVDEQKLGRLLYKLFTVAIRNTPVNGMVRVAGEVLRGNGPSRARPQIRIAITDSGPAPTLEDLEHLVRALNPVEILGAEQRREGVTLTAVTGLGDAEQATVSLRLESGELRTLVLTLPVATEPDAV
jgi:signal transduction histidine kinase